MEGPFARTSDTCSSGRRGLKQETHRGQTIADKATVEKDDPNYGEVELPAERLLLVDPPEVSEAHQSCGAPQPQRTLRVMADPGDLRQELEEQEGLALRVWDL